MGWKEIKTLLLRPASFLRDTAELRGAVARAIQETTQIPIKETDVVIKNRTAVVRAHPALKQELLIQKSKVLEALERRIPKNRLRDVR